MLSGEAQDNAAHAQTFGPRYLIKVPARQQSCNMQGGHPFRYGSQFQYNALSRHGLWKTDGRRQRDIDGPEEATLRHLVGGSHSYAVPGWRGEGAGKPRPGQKRHATFRLGLLGLSQIAASAGQGWRAVRAR